MHTCACMIKKSSHLPKQNTRTGPKGEAICYEPDFYTEKFFNLTFDSENWFKFTAQNCMGKVWGSKCTFVKAVYCGKLKLDWLTTSNWQKLMTFGCLQSRALNTNYARGEVLSYSLIKSCFEICFPRKQLNPNASSMQLCFI